MLQVVPKWKVTFTYDGREPIVVWMHDAFMSNVLRKIADMQFSEKGLDQPYRVTIELVSS